MPDTTRRTMTVQRCYGASSRRCRCDAPRESWLLGALWIAAASHAVYGGSSSVHRKLPSFAEPIPNVTVAAGREVTLTCVVDNLGSFKVAWIHTDRHMLISMHDNLITTNPRYNIAHNGHRTWQLHVREVEEADRGEYMCQINTNPMKKMMGYLHVVVPPRIDDENTSSDAEVHENSDVSLRCRATGTPEPVIKWRREDDALILLSGKKGVPSYQGEYLNMSKVTRLHMGPYLCIAFNGVQPSVSKRILLKVDFAPMIWQPNQLVGAPLGADVTLECNLETHPRGMTFWERDDGTILISSAKYDSLVLETGPYRLLLRLTIRDLKPDDFGTYKCVSKNPLGETEANIKLQEIPRPTSSTIASSREFQVRKHWEATSTQQSNGPRHHLGTHASNALLKEGRRGEYSTEEEGTQGYPSPNFNQDYERSADKDSARPSSGHNLAPQTGIASSVVVLAAVSALLLRMCAV
ncbi:neurotrimin-like isoform X1 [Dermacentor variabilis]|uniref:neurotrimin-like isoform X1 n=1 Tax=Dermacentor variabilis TaxID=34621 RepID=UPI003F5C0C0B